MYKWLFFLFILLGGCANIQESYSPLLGNPVSEVRKELYTHHYRESGGSGRPASAFAPAPQTLSKPTIASIQDNTQKTRIESRTEIFEADRPKVSEKVSSFTQKLFNAKLAFAMKEKANIDEDIKAQLLIDPKQSSSLEGSLNVEGTPLVKTIKVSKIVKATLTAPDFDIARITDEEQILSDDAPTEWLWKLNPKSAGKYEVNLSVTAIIKLDGRESKHHLRTFDKTVIIEITKKQILSEWIKENYKWLVSTLLIPIFVFLFKEKFKKLLEKKN